MRAVLALSFCVPLAFPATALAQLRYPAAKPIRLVVPFPAGGTADLAARAFADPLARSLGQTILVENRGGADGAIASEAVAKALPDGYTLLFGTNTGLAMVPALKKPAPYDALRDFTPVSLVGLFGFFLFTHPSIPASSVADLIAYIKARPGAINYGSANSTGMLAAHLFAQSAGLAMVHVPYKGEAQAMPDLVAGHIQLIFNTPGSVLGFVKEGKIRVLATLLHERSPLLPDTPTAAEAGLPPSPVVPYAALVGPAGMPKAIVDRLAGEAAGVLARAEVRAALARYAFEARSSPPGELATFMQEQLDLWRTAGQELRLADQP